MELIPRPLSRAVCIGVKRLLLPLLCALILILLRPALSHADRYGSFGTGDYIEYWSAYQLLSKGENPYDEAAMYQVQKEIGREANPLMMWNPPWTVTLLSPLLSQPFFSSARIWFGLNVAFLLITGLSCWALVDGKWSTSPLVLLLCTISYPAWITLQMGQTSLLIAAAVAAAFLALKKGCDFTAGALLTLATIKPHLIYLVLITLLWWCIRTARYRLILGGMVTLAAWIALSSWQFPGSLSFWLQHGTASNLKLTASIDQWKVATATYPVREAVNAITGTPATWPMLAVPALTALLLYGYLLRNRPLIRWDEHLPPLVCLSLFTAPYGWIFDQSLLLIPQAVLLTWILRTEVGARTRLLVICFFVGLLALCFAMQEIGFSSHHHFFWVPAAVLAWWYYSIYGIQRNIGASERTG